MNPLVTVTSVFLLHRSPSRLPLPVHHCPIWLTFPPLSHPSIHRVKHRTCPTPPLPFSSLSCPFALSTPPFKTPGHRHQATETRAVKDGIFPQTRTRCGAASAGHDARTPGSPSPELQPCPSQPGQRDMWGSPKAPVSAVTSARPQSSTATK